jgi:hypothetical protein
MAADVKIFVVTEGAGEAAAQLQQLDVVSKAMATTTNRVTSQVASQTHAVHQWTTALGRTSRVLGTTGLVGNLLEVNNAALHAVVAVNALTAAVSSPKLSGAVLKGGLLGLLLVGGATAASKASDVWTMWQSMPGLLSANRSGADALANRVIEMGQAGKLTADEFAFFRKELERLGNMPMTTRPGDFFDMLRGVPTDAEKAADSLATLREKMDTILTRGFEKTDTAHDFAVSKAGLAREWEALKGDNFLTRAQQLHQLESEELALINQGAFETKAITQGIITQEEGKKRSLELEQKLLAVAQERKRIRESGPFGEFGKQLERSRDLENMAVAPFAGAFEGVSTSIQGLINLTMTWGDALRNIATNVLQSIIKGFADMVSAWIVSMAMMVARWVFSHVIMKGVLAAFHFFARLLGWQSTQSQIAQESAKAPSLAMNAATASVGSYGASAVVGMVLALAALGAIIGFALGAFEQGGYTGGGGTDRIAGVVHGQEFVFDAPAVQRIGVGNLEAMRRGGVPESGGGRRGGGGGGIYLVDNRQDAVDRRLSSSEGEDMVMEIVGRNAHKIR